MRRGSVLLFASLLVLGMAPMANATPATVRVIVTLAPDAGPPAQAAERLARAHGGVVGPVYEHALLGFAAELPSGRVEALSRARGVLRVEADGPVGIAGDTVQANATWGLDRVDQRDLPLDGTYRYDRRGAGVRAYVLDTGIRASHDEFEGRVAVGHSVLADPGTDDCHGHGTHVAGTIGGGTHGVAKGVTLVPVRVLDCNGSGSWSGVIAGLDWVLADGSGPKVANLSLSGGAVQSVDDAVENAVAAGVTVVVAAGNGNKGGVAQDACGYSPARAPNAITVSATDGSDTRASFANYGSCVDLFAPGVGITSSTSNRDTSTGVKSGTSMAAPHVAGVAALLLQGTSAVSVADVTASILEGTTRGKVGSPGPRSPNRLVYSRVMLATDGPPTDEPPTDEPPIDGPSEPACTGLTVGAVAGAKHRGSTPITVSWIEDTSGTDTTVTSTGGLVATTTSTSFLHQVKGSGTATYTVSNGDRCGRATVSW